MKIQNVSNVQINLKSGILERQVSLNSRIAGRKFLRNVEHYREFTRSWLESQTAERNTKANPKSAMQAVKSFFNKTFALLKSRWAMDGLNISDFSHGISSCKWAKPLK